MMYGGFDPLAELQKAQRAQLQSLVATRRQHANSLVNTSPPVPTALAPVDTVSLGQGLPELGLIPNPLRSAQHEIPRLDDPDYFKKQNAFYDDILRQAMAIKALERAHGLNNGNSTKSAQKGDLNVVAGNRMDGVKAKKVTVHELGNWPSREHNENVAEYNSHESRFESKKLGTTYQVRVEWEDGSSTVRDVTLEKPGQTVYIDRQY